MDKLYCFHGQARLCALLIGSKERLVAVETWTTSIMAFYIPDSGEYLNTLVFESASGASFWYIRYKKEMIELDS